MNNDLGKLAKLLRYYSLVSTTEAGSGHPSSSLSAADLMAVLMFGRSRKGTESNTELHGNDVAFFRYDLEQPENPNNDRLIFSKGHASPLFYSLWAIAGQADPNPSPRERSSGVSPEDRSFKHPFKRAIEPEEMLTLRKFGSRLEGHPTLKFPYTEVPTGSLGQGLSAGVGMALNAKLDKLSYRTYVLLGDSEMAEGSVWEAMAVAAHYRLDNLVAILDCNRLGQRGETVHGHNTSAYQKKAEVFGWEAMVIDGHNLKEIQEALEWAALGNFKDQEPRSKQVSNFSASPTDRQFPISNGGKPKMIIAKTLKGKGVSFMEDKDGWHGKPLSREELEKALAELGDIDKSIIGEVARPAKAEIFNPPSAIRYQFQTPPIKIINYSSDKLVATRKAYGNALVNLVEASPSVVVLDAETSNSTYAEMVKKVYPEKFIECFIAEQNMVGMALGFSRRGKIPFVSTFAAFFTRAFDQIRMTQYADANIKFCGSHAGVSIGEDGASQMGLEDIAMFRTLLGSVVLYPCDAVSAEFLVWLAAKHQGNVYIRTTRMDTPIIYTPVEADKNHQTNKNLIWHQFRIGGSCILRSSNEDQATVVAAGITVYEALKAYEILQQDGIKIRVIDLYSIKPLDIATLRQCAKETGCIITVEDHFKEGGIGEAVAAALCNYEVHHILENLAVQKMPKTGKPQELLDYEEINHQAIVNLVKKILLQR